MKGAVENLLGSRDVNAKSQRVPTTWKDMRRIASDGTSSRQRENIEQLYKISTPCIDDHQFKKEELEAVDFQK